MSYMNDRHIRQVKLIRIFLPFILFLIVLLYESWEHILQKGIRAFDINFTYEVLFFGILGPLAVFLALTYIMTLIGKQLISTTELEALNRTLEEKVADRTEALAARNAELASANSELQKLDQLKSDFVSLVSHELRGPLTTLNGGLEVALESSNNISPESRRILQVMSLECQRLTEFVQTILDVSRLETGKLTLNPGPIAVHPFLRRAVAAEFADRNRKISWEIPDHLPPIWADEVYLERVIRNLLSNADKYSPPEEQIELRARLVDGHLHLSVSDHGPGIPIEKQPVIFERFQRLESGDRIRTKGWGLGLYFARALAVAQGGELTVQSPAHASRRAPGSAFTLTIPITSEAPDYA